MGLRSTISKAVGSAINALGDIPATSTYRRTSSVYNPATGTNVITNTDYTILKSLMLSYENMEIDKNLILATDRKYLIQASLLPVASVNIATDYIIASDGQIFSIIRVTKDPAGATFSMQLRSPS